MSIQSEQDTSPKGGADAYYDMTVSILRSVMQKRKRPLSNKSFVFFRDLMPLKKLSPKNIKLLILGGGPIGHYLVHQWHLGIRLSSIQRVMAHPFSALLRGYNPSYRYAVKDADYVIVPSFFAKRWFSKGLFTSDGNDKVHVVWPCINPVMVHEFDKGESNMVLVLARFSAEKRLEGALRLISSYKGRGRIRVVFAGFLNWAQKSYLKNLINLSKQLKIQDVCSFYPNVSDSAKNFLLQKAKILIHPTPDGLFEIAPLEAMSWKVVPVINAESTLVHELGMTKEPFVYQRVDDGASFLDSLLGSDALLRSLQRDVRDLALEIYGKSMLMAKDLIEAICECHM